MGRAERLKGARGENEVAALLTESLGIAVKRKLGQARDGGDDIQVGRWRLEVKRRERIQIEDWCRQVEECLQIGETPVVVFRRSGQPWRACLLLEDLIPLLRESLP